MHTFPLGCLNLSVKKNEKDGELREGETAIPA